MLRYLTFSVARHGFVFLSMLRYSTFSIARHEFVFLFMLRYSTFSVTRHGFVFLSMLRYSTFSVARHGFVFLPMLRYSTFSVARHGVMKISKKISNLSVKNLAWVCKIWGKPWKIFYHHLSKNIILSSFMCGIMLVLKIVFLP